MFKAAIPLLRVQASRAALDFYCGRLGFTRRSTYQPDPAREDPAYHVLVREAAMLHVSSFSGDGVAGGVVTVAVDDIEALHGELLGKGVDTQNGIMAQDWGNREVYVRDPAGNTIRFQSV
ncbi:MAG: glyoxalase superfamily protein [Reyranellaceae bacterium]